MISSQFLLENPDYIAESAKNKGVQLDIETITLILSQYKKLSQKVQVLREERNKIAKASSTASPEDRPAIIEQGKKIKEELEQEEQALKDAHANLHTVLISIPNPAKPDVKVGKDESENEVIRKYKEPTTFTFSPKDHLELGESLDLIDVDRATKVSGSRFVYLKNEAVLLEFALFHYALEFLMKEGFTPIIPPTLIKRETMAGLGYMENGGEEDMFSLSSDDMFLVGTAEHALVPMHKDEILNAKEFPKRYVGFSSAFRREAGSYGKDTKGIIRVHQFDKIEMVSFVEKDKDDAEHEYLLGLEEKLFQGLGIPYQVIKMCTGDLGFPAARKYDIEAWIPTQEKYREVTSVSTVTDFQSRRLKIRYRKGEETEFASVLNGTAFAIGRTLVAILENYQQEDGSVLIPEVLRKYVGKDVITPK